MDGLFIALLLLVILRVHRLRLDLFGYFLFLPSLFSLLQSYQSLDRLLGLGRLLRSSNTLLSLP